MKKLFFFLAAILLVSCYTEQIETEELENVTINAKVSLKGIWQNDTRAVGTLYAASYLFNPDGECIEAYSRNIYSDSTFTFSNITTPGTYTICTIAGLEKNEFFPKTDLTKTAKHDFPNTPRLIYQGSTTINISASNVNYNAVVTAKNLMSKISLRVSGVSPQTGSIKALLPSQSSQFSLMGVLSGSTASDTIRFTKADTPASNGTYTWTSDTLLVNPCADQTTAMSVRLFQKVGEITNTLNTTSTIICRRATHVSLVANLSQSLKNGVSINSQWDNQEGTLLFSSPE